MAELPTLIAELVERFDRNRQQYTRGTCNEAQTRLGYDE